jgi:lincosamide nucleotidyltransferase A/C/D/E
MAMLAPSVIEVIDVLERAGVDLAIAGGWAVDALLGHETREHDDLDLAIDVAQIDRAVATLRDLGYDVAADQLPARIELRGGGRAVDLHPVTFGPDGVGHQPDLAGEAYEYPPGSMEARGRIGERTVRCLTPDLLVRLHDGYEPRAIDRADMAALARRFEVPLPPAYLSEPVE